MRLLALAVAVLICGVSAGPALASAGPAGNWSFDEGSGARVADSSGNGNNGVLSAGASWVQGLSGTALSFSGATGQVQVPGTVSLEPSSAVTVSAWVKRDGSPGTYRYVVAKGASGCVAASYGLYTGPRGGLRFYVSSHRGSVYASSADAGQGVWDGKWHLVVGMYDGSTLQLFVDGTEVAPGTSYPGSLEYLLPNSNDLFIGNYPGCADHAFAGVIDDVMIWNRALDVAELQALMPTSTGDRAAAPNPASDPSSLLSPTSTPTPPAAGPGSSRPKPEPGSGSVPPPGESGIPPAIRRLRLSPSITVGASRRQGRRKRGIAATISYDDTEAARSTFIALLVQPGVRRGRRCARPPRGPSGRRTTRCTRYETVGSFAHDDPVGFTSFPFARLTRHKLVLGRYLLRAIPAWHGLVGATVTIPFTVRR